MCGEDSSCRRGTRCAPRLRRLASRQHTRATLNAGSSKVVPWNLEQAPVPSSPAHGTATSRSMPRNRRAQREGIGQRLWVRVPSGVDGIWTIAQTGLNRDITDPTQELTVHVDQRTGSIVGRGGWNEYSPMARAVAAGIPLHMGSLGWWNLLGASLVCLSVIALSLSGLVMWWLRRPARGWRLAAPPRPDPARVPLYW